MTTSTLEITRVELVRAVAHEWGYDPATVDATELNDINDSIQSGERNFYRPPILAHLGEKTSHKWSWAQPILTLPLKANQADYELPDLFGGLVGSLVFASDSNALGLRLRFTGIGEILADRQQTGGTATGQPDRFAIYPAPADGTKAQRQFASFWPTPDAGYIVQGPYFITFNAVTSTAPYPMGGQPHAETLRAACLAAAEMESTKQQGPRYAAFLQELAASVSFDRSVSGPHNFGYNGDHSGPRGTLRRHWGQEVTYNSASYATN